MDKEEDFLLDEVSRAVLLRKLIAAKREATEEKQMGILGALSSIGGRGLCD